MPKDYIPTKLADRIVWAATFASLISAAPPAYGLTVGDATAITAAQQTLAAAYLLSSAPETRTSASVASTNGADLQMQAVLRPYAQRVKLNDAVSDAQKVALGINPPSGGSTPVPEPTGSPGLVLVGLVPGVVTIGYTESALGGSRAKPEGVTGLQLFVSYGQAPAVDPTVATFVGTYTKTPLRVKVPANRAGQTATFWANWTTTSGKGGVAARGPSSAALSTVVV